ncbi:hypothetical protein [Vibrio algarum]|uniref:Uncharacterized protein n=1 Tax=Vibrio algarum TaxID=3020714 RepID=A0ABT4YUQ9_9VIBR|nr:hypothetical protein [Vibrio sp. KJ40-1]MDB1125317.1 hypothetical protein [Vibrio sp. KJ40-1]
MQSSKPVQTIQIEMSIEKFEELLYERQLCAAHVRCLNSQSKQLIRELCLKACQKSICCAESDSSWFEHEYRIKVDSATLIASSAVLS